MASCWVLFVGGGSGNSRISVSNSNGAEAVSVVEKHKSCCLFPFPLCCGFIALWSVVEKYESVPAFGWILPSVTVVLYLDSTYESIKQHLAL